MVHQPLTIFNSYARQFLFLRRDVYDESKTERKIHDQHHPTVTKTYARMVRVAPNSRSFFTINNKLVQMFLRYHDTMTVKQN